MNTKGRSFSALLAWAILVCGALGWQNSTIATPGTDAAITE
jgi:hypothetical protein